MNRNIIIFAVVFFSIIILSFNKPAKETVNVYGWYGVMNREVLSDFEKETGIKVIYDVYDNNDTLEAKLLATNSGYDVVFPSFIPYAARQCNMGAYTKLNKTEIPNLKNIDGYVTEKYQSAGGDTDYLVPIFWGTIGIAYDTDIVYRTFKNEEPISYNILLDPEKIKLISKFGISFPEEYIDIFPQTQVFLNLEDSPNSKTPARISSYMNHFKNLRKYIKKFSSNTMISDLISGEVVVAIGSSDNAWRAQISAKHVGKNLKYIIPKGSGMLWVDCVGIPEKAPHKENAHKFLNYLLRPEVAAKITNYSGILTNIPTATAFFKKEITCDDQICPFDNEVLSNLMIGVPSKNAEDAKYDKMATRAWSQIRMNEFNYTKGIDE